MTFDIIGQLFLNLCHNIDILMSIEIINANYLNSAGVYLVVNLFASRYIPESCEFMKHNCLVFMFPISFLMDYTHNGCWTLIVNALLIDYIEYDMVR